MFNRFLVNGGKQGNARTFEEKAVFSIYEKIQIPSKSGKRIPVSRYEKRKLRSEQLEEVGQSGCTIHLEAFGIGETRRPAVGSGFGPQEI